MIIRIEEPASVNPVTVDWQKMLNKMVATTSGFCLIDFTHDGINPPKLAVGSRFDLNGSYFAIVMEDEEITGYENIPANTPAYIYAVPNNLNPGEATVCSFEFRTTAPTLNVPLGGMFDGPARCLGWVDTDGLLGFRVWSSEVQPSQNVAITGIWRVGFLLRYGDWTTLYIFSRYAFISRSVIPNEYIDII